MLPISHSLFFSLPSPSLKLPISLLHPSAVITLPVGLGLGFLLDVSLHIFSLCLEAPACLLFFFLTNHLGTLSLPCFLFHFLMFNLLRSFLLSYSCFFCLFLPFWAYPTIIPQGNSLAPLTSQFYVFLLSDHLLCLILSYS